MDLMTDPVVGNDGHTYERSAITEWLAAHNVSPMTRRTMILADLHPNYSLRTAIERWRLANEAAPQPIAVLGPPAAEKAFTVEAYTMPGNKTALAINTTHQTPMETVLIGILDVSGSMDTSATTSASAAAVEGGQFSRLDLVKHSMVTLATLLNSQYATTPSSLSLVSFSSAANLVMPNTKMDDIGLGTATTAIRALRSSGATNIWDGLRIGLHQAEQALLATPNANVQLLLLTDGEPSPDLLPPMGIKATLQRKLAALKGRITISTFGFGYSLDADLLESICTLGNGTYGFIPDCSMVGTVFINWAAKALLTLAHHLAVELPTGQKYAVGDIIKGRAQTLVITQQTAPLDTVKLTYDNGLEYTAHVEQNPANTDFATLEDLKAAVEQIKLCKRHQEARNNASLLQVLKGQIDANLTATEFMRDAATDIESTDDSEGQLLKAVSRDDWWRTWGRNHCISYYHALKLQQCVNFKDKALQHFASDEFKVLQEKGIDIFSNIPAPTPSVQSYAPSSYYGGGGGLYARGGANAPNPTVPTSLFTPDMSQYVSQAGPCFTGDCRVLMSDMRLKRVQDLRKGDRVLGGLEVQAVLYTPVNREVDMVVFQTGLKITPWHPMKMETDLYGDVPWVFPNDVGKKVKMFVDAYYNLVLDQGHVVELNSYTVCTLGHGFEENDVIKHPYFGTQAVIEDLKKHPDWETGWLHMDPLRMVRSSETGLVIKI
jgi:Mg-chelatase subunit ChlD